MEHRRAEADDVHNAPTPQEHELYFQQAEGAVAAPSSRTYPTNTSSTSGRGAQVTSPEATQDAIRLSHASGGPSFR